MTDQATDGGKPLTGRKVLAIFVGAFAVIIGVNFFMAYNAVHTFPGLEVENGYISSQHFNEEKMAQEALGWDVTASFDGNDKLLLSIIGPDGAPARVKAIEGMLGRATERSDDQTLTFVENADGVHVAQLTPLDYGKWELRFIATAANDVPFRQRIQLIIPEE